VEVAVRTTDDVLKLIRIDKLQKGNPTMKYSSFQECPIAEDAVLQSLPERRVASGLPLDFATCAVHSGSMRATVRPASSRRDVMPANSVALSSRNIKWIGFLIINASGDLLQVHPKAAGAEVASAAVWSELVAMIGKNRRLVQS